MLAINIIVLSQLYLGSPGGKIHRISIHLYIYIHTHTYIYI